MNMKGQALVEYLLIIAIIGLLAIFFIAAFGGFVKDSFTEMFCELTDKEYVEGEKEGYGTCID